MTSRNQLLALTAATVLLAGPGWAQTSTQNNPPGTAATRALDRAAGTNTSGANPQNSDGTPNNPAGTAAGRAAEGVTTGTPSSSTPPNPPASTATPSTPTTGSVAQPSTTGTSPSLNNAPTGSATPGSATVGSRPTAAADHQRASKIVGVSVYNDRNESIGSVDDLVLGANGTPTVIVSVGGFLGIGAKLVAVPFQDLRWSGNESRWVIAGATRDSLTSLPTFEYGSNRG